MASVRLALFVAVICAASVATLDGDPLSGISENRNVMKLQHLKEQFELFKKELEQMLDESRSSSSNQAEEIAEQVAVAEDVKRCDCSDASQQKRCPESCRKKTPKTAVAAAAEAEAGSGARTAKTCERRCPTCECEESQPVAMAPVAVQDSAIMKRFLKALPAADQQLIQHARAKKTFIERLIRRSHYGPNKDDIEGYKAAKSGVVSSIEEKRSFPADDTSEMAAFKKSLDPNEQQLLKKYQSKTQYIQGVLTRNVAVDKRDAIPVAGAKRLVDDPVVVEYMQNLPEDEKLLIENHPSAVNSLKEAILAGTQTEEQAASKRGSMPVAGAKRLVDDPVVVEYMQNLPEDEKLLIENHPSAVNSLKEAILAGTQTEEQAAKRDVGSGQILGILSNLESENDRNMAKNELTRIENFADSETGPVASPEEGDEVLSKIIEDIRMAKKGGINFSKLLQAMKKRASAAK